MKNTISEMKNTLEGIKIRLDEAQIKSASWMTGYKKPRIHNKKIKKKKTQKKKKPRNPKRV